MSEFARVRERVRQSRSAIARELAIGATLPAGAEERIGSAFRIGDRAFDTVSGEHVEVIGAGVENVVVSVPER